MKIRFLPLLGLLALLLVACYSDDDENRYISLSIADALVFANNQNYMVGDTIFVELGFDRYLDEEGFANKLDIFESSGAESFRYNFSLNKFSEISDGFRRVEISPEFLIPGKGTVDGFNEATAQLNPERTRYESRVGVILAEAGRFELDLAVITLYSDAYLQDKVQIEIQHIFSNTVPNFEFEVN